MGPTDRDETTDADRDDFRRGARLASLTSGGAIPEIADYRVVADPDDMFIGTVGMDYCLTFAVSSKALLLYSELDEDTFTPHLLKLSSVMLAIHVVLMVGFYYGYWRFVGLAL